MMPPKPDWVKQQIQPEDADFLMGLIAEVQPKSVLEIGVASGWSSLAILKALAALEGERRLYSFDISQRCSWAQQYAIGSVVHELAPELAKNWTLRQGISKDATRFHYGENFGLAFIDADHAHPWPTCDLLTILPTMAPGSWVVLHDVNMPGIGGHQHGPKYLFEGWTGEKRQLEIGGKNIGGIRLPDDTEKVKDMVRPILSIPWEHHFLQTRPDFEHLL